MLLDQVSIHSWINTNGIKTESGQPLDFIEHKYLFDIYSDRSPNIVEMKAAQLGLSTMEIFRTFHRAYYQKLDVIYILPTFTDVQDFAGGKVNRIIDNNAVLQKWIKDKDSTTQKQVGKSTIYYRGSWNERQALMITADWLILDEFDRCKQEVLEQYESRLQHSKYGYKSIFSNPSAPDFGVHKYFKQTDQKMWFVNHSCKQQILLDESCIDYEQEKFICPKCKGEITNEERRQGEWIPTATGLSGWSGYWIPLWISPKVSASKIAEYKRSKTSEYFANFVAGLPFIGGGNKVSAQTLISCLSKEVNTQEDRIIIGVDTGLPIYYVLANKQGYFHYGKCSDPTTGKDPYDELRALLRRFPNSIMVADQGGDLIGIRKLQADFGGRVFLTYYRANRKTQELITWGNNDKYGEVVADRDRLIQLFIDEMLDKRVTFNGTESDWQEYISHWMNIYRTWEENSLGVREFKWERQGPDHFCFSGNTKIKTIDGNKNIRDIVEGDRVYTKSGLKKVYKSWLTQYNAKTVTAFFSNGTKIIATPKHKFITSRGQTTLDSLTYYDKLYTWKKLNTKESSIEDIQTRLGEQIKFTSLQTGHIGLKNIKDFINKYGLIIMGISPKVMLYIIKMVTRLIIQYQTWLVSLEVNISRNMQKKCMKIRDTEKDKKNILTQLDIYPTLGEKLKRVKNGIANILIKVSYWINQGFLNALSVALKVLHEVDRAVSFVPQDVVIVGLHVNIGVNNVYNISVEDEHEYYANGILVSNCHASIYARIGLDKYSETKATIVGEDVLAGLPIGRDVVSNKPMLARVMNDEDYKNLL